VCDFAVTPDTYQQAGLERGTATSKSTTTGTTSAVRSTPYPLTGIVAEPVGLRACS
jgi:hypothetical protein